MLDDSFFFYLWLLAGAFALSASAVTLQFIYMHLRHYYEPNFQKFIIRLLWMVPIYSLDSFLSMRFHEWALYLDMLRDCYEAYVLYSFFSLLVAYLGGVEELEELLELIPPQAHPFPLCNLPKYKPGSKFLLWCRRCILQFVLIKPVLAIISILLEWAHLYADGSLSPARGYLWIAIVNNVSITVSLYFLVLFYIVTEDHLQPYKPLPKFLCIKAIIFFSFWQGIAIVTLVRLNFIVDQGTLSAQHVAMFSQNFLICIEMFVMAWVFRSVFPFPQYKPGTAAGMLPGSPSRGDREENGSSERRAVSSPNSKPSQLFKNFQDVANVTDVLDDARAVLMPSAERHSKDH
mmetsp:Transcript_8624/g.35933  ORF Transcript_8624/g.35933 Transcript_8624/m.35933 type:complete len:347 (+) Transcript_8624:214-1254(+)|eukprot:CAMPEP_0114628434 /NCGR_PEP_ID=MMETSP0168-20121206/12819_1 /TAXON_ID=95228 ORGANISM="Vannella sp., Strain DIVA3 517/6/12" /NCGR_SAMPLE_ID=MMETSP0168 /ASSEMBLY_ACC=CAM_ASM_000044 /LENGTH=346 /DNA_ID=CAMNT_0001839817 /DNA_START=140 /DNA_END=1180 /DNA_ORIENTATION=-